MSDAVTCTVLVPDTKPAADAVTVAEPGATPVTIGCVAGCVWPAAMTTDAGDTLTFVVSLLTSVTVVPPCGAGEDKVTGKATD